MRKTAMRLILLSLILLANSACTTISVTADNGAKVDIRTDREVSALPINAQGNTVPVSAIP